MKKLLRNILAIARVCGPGAAAAYVFAIVRNFPEIWRSRTLVAADRDMASSQWAYSVQGVSFVLDGRLFSAAREMLCRQVYFPNESFALRTGTTVVDLGSNAGLFSVLAALVGCRVIAVEAQRGFIRDLMSLAASLGVEDRIYRENALVGSRSGILSDLSRLESASHFDGFVPSAITMDDLLDKHGVTEVDFLKVDVEGSEFDLFGSGGTWLTRVRRIAMEVHSEFGLARDLQQILTSHGFAVQLRDTELQPVDRLSGSSGYLFAAREPL